MKYLLLFLIKQYQKISWYRNSKTCLFKESCSTYVSRITLEKGFVKGLKALYYRYKNCRVNYHILRIKGELFLITDQNICIQEEHVNEKILQSVIQSVRSN